MANHIGMTLGLQKGARISQAMWNEAIATAPWLQKAEARFDEHGYLSGVTLTPQQIRQMVSLGQDRRKRQWQQAQEAGTMYGVNVPIPDDLDVPSSTLEGPKTKALRQVRARTSGWKPPEDAPPAPKENGHKLKADGKVIAVSNGGQWVEP